MAVKEKSVASRIELEFMEAKFNDLEKVYNRLISRETNMLSAIEKGTESDMLRQENEGLRKELEEQQNKVAALQLELDIMNLTNEIITFKGNDDIVNIIPQDDIEVFSEIETVQLL